MFKNTFNNYHAENCMMIVYNFGTRIQKEEMKEIQKDHDKNGYLSSITSIARKYLVQSVFERYTQLKGCKYVDEIIPYESEDDLKNLLQTLDIDIRFLGEDYLRDNKPITGYNTCMSRKIQLYYCGRFHPYSSTELKKRIVSMSNTLTD